MKKVLVLGLMLVGTLSIGQTNKKVKIAGSPQAAKVIEIMKVDKDSIYLNKLVDDMGGKSYIMTNRSIVLASDNNKQGFRLDCNIKDDFSMGDFIVTSVGIGSCSENDEMIILFEDGSKITKKSWKDFNCEGLSYFNISSSDIKSLRTLKISKIRMTNGRSYESFTGEIEAKDKRYFQQLFYALDNKLVTIKNR
jgi:hypothetical protein